METGATVRINVDDGLVEYNRLGLKETTSFHPLASVKGGGNSNDGN
jgi:hypothetical protein